MLRQREHKPSVPKQASVESPPRTPPPDAVVASSPALLAIRPIQRRIAPRKPHPLPRRRTDGRFRHAKQRERPSDHYFGFGPLFSELHHAGVRQGEPKLRRSEIRHPNTCHSDMCHPDTYHPYMRHRDLRHPDKRHPQLAHIASRAYHLERIDHLERLDHLEIDHPDIGHSHLSES